MTGEGQRWIVKVKRPDGSSSVLTPPSPDREMTEAEAMILRKDLQVGVEQIFVEEWRAS